MTMEQQDFTLETFESAVRQHDMPVIVDFGAIWSVACLMYKEKLEEAHHFLEKYAIFGSVDIDRVPELTERFSIITIPTTLIFYQGKIAKQYMGIQELETLQAAIEEITGIKAVDLSDEEEDTEEEQQ